MLCTGEVHSRLILKREHVRLEKSIRLEWDEIATDNDTWQSTKGEPFESQSMDEMLASGVFSEKSVISTKWALSPVNNVA